MVFWVVFGAEKFGSEKISFEPKAFKLTQQRGSLRRDRAASLQWRT